MKRFIVQKNKDGWEVIDTLLNTRAASGNKKHCVYIAKAMNGEL